MMRKAPSLVDLCVQKAVDNVRYLGNVGETETHLLERILPHCTLEQLTHIENRTEDRDLSPITDRLWKEFYKRQFGIDSTNLLIERMRKNKVTFKWRPLFEAKTKEREQALQKTEDRIRQRYQEADAKKQSRQVQLVTKVPPPSKKRFFFGGVAASNIGNTKSSLMKKAKIEFVNSREVKNLAAMKNNATYRNYSQSSSMAKPNTSSGFGSSSSTKPKTPIRKRF